MKSAVRFTAVIGAALLAGCSMTEGEFNNMQATIGGSPAVKRQVIADCIARQKRKPPSEIKEVALVMNVSLSNFPEIACKRLWNATAAGRITYADYVKLSQPSADSSKVIRILQGR
ncbi:hypothetical protein [Mesorhizobium sp. IMUNJ 23232]|uniref:hypothetical protein n=1 Tax=Mesorhizobium sp. IMUNJ 23232 TaxID=3376064 RepID=UPI00378AA868